MVNFFTKKKKKKTKIKIPLALGIKKNWGIQLKKVKEELKNEK